MSDEQHSSGELISVDYSAEGGPTEAKQELQRGGESWVVEFGEPGPCRECRGTGSIALLVTARPCEACLGTGQVWPVLRREHTPAAWGYVRRKRHFDDQGRLMVEERWFEPVPAPAGSTRSDARKFEIRSPKFEIDSKYEGVK